MERTDPLIIISDATLEELKINRKPTGQAVKELQKMINGFKSASKTAKGRLKSIYKDEIERLERAMVTLQTESVVIDEAMVQAKLEKLAKGITILTKVKISADDTPEQLDAAFKKLRAGKWTLRAWEEIQGMAVVLKNEAGITLPALKGMPLLLRNKDGKRAGAVYENELVEAKIRKVRVVDPHVVEVGIDKQGNWYWKGKNGLVNSYTGKSSKETMRQEARQVGNGKFIDKAIKQLEGIVGESLEENIYRTKFKKLGEYGYYKVTKAFALDAWMDVDSDDIDWDAPMFNSKQRLKVGSFLWVGPAGIYIMPKKTKIDNNKHPRVNITDQDEVLIAKNTTRVSDLKGKVVQEEMASVGAGTIPTGPESVGVKVKPDFNFKGLAGFDCGANTFGKCLQGKKKYKRWNTYLDRNDDLVGKVKNYMGQSYKNTNFVLRNNATGEMVVARRT